MRRSAPSVELGSIRRPRPLARSSRRPTTSAMQIVALREQAGLTQVEFAERTGISQADVSRIERGPPAPPPSPPADRRGPERRGAPGGQDGVAGQTPVKRTSPDAARSGRMSRAEIRSDQHRCASTRTPPDRAAELDDPRSRSSIPPPPSSEYDKAPDQVRGLLLSGSRSGRLRPDLLPEGLDQGQRRLGRLVGGAVGGDDRPDLGQGDRRGRRWTVPMAVAPPHLAGWRRFYTAEGSVDEDVPPRRSAPRSLRPQSERSVQLAPVKPTTAAPRGASSTRSPTASMTPDTSLCG